MARIKIEDLPKDMKISKEEMKKVLGGLSTVGAVDPFYICMPTGRISETKSAEKKAVDFIIDNG